MDKKKILNILFLTIIIVLAISLRVLYLHTDIWYDEACSWFTAKQAFPGGIMNNLLTVDLQHTPLYFFLLHLWIKLFGQTETAMRTLSFLFSILSVPLVYVIANKITSKTQAMFATAIAGVSPLLVIFSCEIRMYPIAVFLVLLSLNYLIDFEQKRNNASLIKLIITNLLIPYTLVGGIFYNISLFTLYIIYLNSYKKDLVKKYLKGEIFEFIGLIPYFMLIFYYAKMRSLFVITHEGDLEFFQIVDVIRNFFGATVTDNIYWPSLEPYQITLMFTLLVIVPCVYFIYGFVQGRKTENKFIEMIYNVFVSIFVLSVLFSLFQVNVFTARYILYILPPIFILSVIGLFNKLSEKHCKIFLSLFIIASSIFTYYHAGNFKVMKTTAFKTVKLEADRLNLNSDDIVIMPFGADAPYYFRELSSARVFPFDFHKEARNPYNSKFYDKKHQQRMLTNDKNQVLYEEIVSNKVFSDVYFKYFIENVNNTVPAGRYVLLAMYGTDAGSLITIDQLRNAYPNEQKISLNFLDAFFKKYLCDTRAMLDMNFNYLGSFTKDNYTFLLYQKR